MHGHIANAFNRRGGEDDSTWESMFDLMLQDKAVVLGWWLKNVLEKEKNRTNFTPAGVLFLMVACVDWTDCEPMLTAFVDTMIQRNKDPLWVHLFTLGLGGVMTSPVRM